MKFNLNSLVKRPDLPVWFTTLNYLAFLGFIFWPFTIGISFMIFDAPDSTTIYNYILFALCFIYPLILLGNMLLSFWLFKYQKITATLLPLIVLTIYCFIYFKYLN
jgi:hypothetical protein